MVPPSCNETFLQTIPRKIPITRPRTFLPNLTVCHRQNSLIIRQSRAKFGGRTLRLNRRGSRELGSFPLSIIIVLSFCSISRAKKHASQEGGMRTFRAFSTSAQLPAGAIVEAISSTPRVTRARFIAYSIHGRKEMIRHASWADIDFVWDYQMFGYLPIITRGIASISVYGL